MKKIVLLKGAFIDSMEEFVLKECLGIMFPDCKIEIRSAQAAISADEERHTWSDQKKSAS